MAGNLLEDLERYLEFGEADALALRSLHEVARPSFPAVAEAFYARILAHPGARAVLQGGESEVGHLRRTLLVWLDQLLSGPWDEAYFEARCRIGRVHVRIGMPQHYMFGAMNVIRLELERIAEEHLAARPAELAACRRALAKVLDLELGVMLHTYREDLLAREARAERLATFGQLVGSIAHDLRNPLGVIETSLFILRGRLPDDERARKHVDRIGDQVAVANGIISDLLDMIRDRPMERTPVELVEVLAAAAAAVARPAGVCLVAEGLEGLPPVDGDAGQLRQAFVNLLENAVQAVSPRGEVRVAGRAEGGEVTVAVEDTGPGVDPAIRNRLFEPLITTRPGGVGLGLALVKRVAERHGGAVSHEPRLGGGARFLVRLPVRA